MDLEVRHLRVVCAIGEAGSITRAAARLGVAQPTLTAQLSRIERMLGGPLFVRTRQGAAPTALGEFVLAKARSVIVSFDAIQREAAAQVGFMDGRRPLRYTANPGPLMVGLLDGLQSVFPGTEVTLRTETHMSAALTLVASGQQDLGTVVEYVRDDVPTLPPGVVTLTVATEPAFVLLPDGHPLAALPQVGIAQLRDARWVLPVSQGSGMMEAFTALCAGQGFTATVRHEAEASAARELIAAGQAVGLGQATFRSTPGVVPRPLTGSPLRIRHVLVWRRGSALARRIPSVAERAERAYADAVARSPHYLAWLTEHAALE
ncbi:LysR family transcriptional regulator [Streptomyces sp. NBC_01235]|uniref:LysR family transcriptional regulator n=1 Tax=Streptomyces sp. NBC_01235 TaxID=2903788 RepID=UPI002E0D529E|nr:LysR family transcriptional regulator [Streptomyces sp. NBC_01235]